MKLIKGNTYYYDSVVAQGGYNQNNSWLIIDSGNDDSSAKKSIRPLDNPDIKYIFNTHSHADHCGGNAYFQKKFDTKIIAPIIEDKFIEAPLLEPVYLYGAIPPKAMKNKFLFAKASSVSKVIETAGNLQLEFNSHVENFDLINLSGHSPNMMGIITPDNIAFIGDALLGEAYLKKHSLMFTFDVARHLDSIEALKSLQADGYVLAHGGYTDNLQTLIEANRSSLMRTSEMVLASCKQEAMTFDQLHARLYDLLALEEILSTHMLNRSVIRAHVQYLESRGNLEFVINKGELLIQNK